jgi:DHA2 family multidrug resistance protein
VGLLGFFMASAFLFDPPYLRKPARVDWPGLVLMVMGFGCLQLFLDRGEREDWFDSTLIVTLAIVAGVALVGFVARELLAKEPVLDLAVFTDRNFAFGATFIALIGIGMFSSMVLLALYSQKLLGYDALTSGLVLAPGGVGNMFSLILCGRLVTRVDQRVLLTFGCLVNALSLYMMSNLTLGMDYWTLTLPRVIQGFALGFIFVPLSTLTLATIRRDKLVNATSAYNVLRNLGGSVGIALATTLLAQRSQFHQQNLVSHVTVWDPATQERLARWTSHFLAHGSDAFTAQRQAVAMLYQDAVGQAQVLAYADDFWLLAILFSIVPLFLPLMRRVRVDAASPREEAEGEGGRVPPLPAPVD